MQIGSRDLKQLPLEMRKGLLATLLEGSAAGIVYSDNLDAGDGVPMFEAACKMGLEGIVSKRNDKAYTSGPCKHWVKIKNPGAPWNARLSATRRGSEGDGVEATAGSNICPLRTGLRLICGRNPGMMSRLGAP